MLWLNNEETEQMYSKHLSI